MTACEVCQSVLPLDNESSRLRPPGREHILIIEDDPLSAQVLREGLESTGYHISGVVASAQEAVRLAQSAVPDLVLMDIHISGEADGVEAAGQISKLQIPVVFVIGCFSPTVLDRAMLTEPYGFLLKPYRTPDLELAIQVALQKSRAERDRQRLLTRLQKVLTSVKTLTGRLSICCYCKKIKNTAGEWPEVEAFVMEHSHASFTHGMCPVCFERVQKQLKTLEEGNPDSDSMVLG